MLFFSMISMQLNIQCLISQKVFNAQPTDQTTQALQKSQNTENLS